MGEANRFESSIGTRNYIGQKQRLKILLDKLKQLKDEYERKCKSENCPAS